jgi:hypothetical protein
MLDWVIRVGNLGVLTLVRYVVLRGIGALLGAFAFGEWILGLRERLGFGARAVMRCCIMRKIEALGQDG